MGLHVLITNIFLQSRTGTELYVRDLALELKRQGHQPAVYTPIQGSIAEELKAAGVPVCSSLRTLEFRTDVIHGHHRVETMMAVLHNPGVPAIFICHDLFAWHDNPPIHPRIRRYLGVSLASLERLREAGIPEERIRLALNFVDLKRFLPRPPLPQHPRRALVFSNYASAHTHLPAIAEACLRAGLKLDVVGAGVGKCSSQPENVLGQYDLVFARARAAMEAMAVGTAVVLCDFTGLGPMVTAGEFHRLRPLNFGFKALQEPLHPQNIIRQIRRYDAQNAARVRDLLRSIAGLDRAAKELVDVYQQIIEEQHRTSPSSVKEKTWRYRHLLFRDALLVKVFATWDLLKRRRVNSLTRLPGIDLIKRGMKRILLD
jgi:glycosyltransferase involved in cell wall biosynthesis